MSRQRNRTLEQKLIKSVARTSINFNLIKPNDKIIIAISGGKDSYALLHLLKGLTRRLPFKITMLPVHVYMGQPNAEPELLEKWLKNNSCNYKIIKDNSFDLIIKNTKPGDNPCPVCARMRRGILYTFAMKHGFNKIALGHHREDALATFMLNLFYSGKLQSMPPKYTTDSGQLEVIRPLIEISQSDIITLSNKIKFPSITCSLYNSRPDQKRKFIENLLNKIEKDNPRIKESMLGALKNVKPTHLMDKSVIKKQHQD
jgi:tRNA 2-thiocytidine biosynthesis protein TtcA